MHLYLIHLYDSIIIMLLYFEDSVIIMLLYLHIHTIDDSAIITDISNTSLMAASSLYCYILGHNHNYAVILSGQHYHNAAKYQQTISDESNVITYLKTLL